MISKKYTKMMIKKRSKRLYGQFINSYTWFILVSFLKVYTSCIYCIYSLPERETIFLSTHTDEAGSQIEDVKDYDLGSVIA